MLPNLQHEPIAYFVFSLAALLLFVGGGDKGTIIVGFIFILNQVSAFHDSA